MPDPFPTTRWSVVLAAGEEDGTRSRRALADLCQVYWFPLYTYVRGRGYSTDDTPDLIQSFFANMIEHRYIEIAAADRGLFRRFLLHKIKHFLADESDRDKAQKRGGHLIKIELNGDEADDRYWREVTQQHSPEQEFDRQWAIATLDRVMKLMGDEAERGGKSEEFAELRRYLTDSAPQPSYAEVATRLGSTEAAVKQAIYRLRRRFGKSLRDEIAQTAMDPSGVDDELRHLLSVLS